MPSAPDDHPDDARLAARIARGERTALERTYLRHAGAVYRFGLALCGNPAWAADATQEAFLQFATRPGGFVAGRSLAAYLCGIARFHLLGLLREPRAPALAGTDETDGPELAADALNEPLALLVQRQSTEALLAAVRRLPLPLREAVILVDLQERDYQQAAQIAAVPLNTLRTRLHRGRRQLAAMLGADGAAATERKQHVLA